MAIRSGQQYLDGLDDGRDVRMAGARVENVATHPALRGPCETIAGLYDRQHDPSLHSLLTHPGSDQEDDTAIAFASPRSAEDLRRRRLAFKSTADATFGLMGRSPDFIATAVTAFAGAADYFGSLNTSFARNITNFWRFSRSNDLFLAHATINPSTNRAAGSSHSSNASTHLKVVAEESAGLRMSGAKLISTLAPIADELVVFPLPGYRDGDEAFTAAFAVPTASPGLRFVCRESLGGSAARAPLDHPLGRYDEMDATCIFDDVLVPWDRVFFYGDVDMANRLYDATTARHHTGHHGITRGVAKAELLVAIAVALAESAQTSRFLHVQEMLGEVIGMLELARGAVLQSEEQAQLSHWGVLTPAIEPIQAVRYHFPKMCARMIEVIHIIGGGSLLAAPTFADLDDSGGERVEALFAAADGGSGRQRIGLLKLAWDASGDAFGQRQMQYERYHSGDPVRLAAQQYLAYDTERLHEIVRRASPTSDRSVVS